MTLDNLPKIIEIDGGTGEVESPEIELSNYQAVTFLIGNTDGESIIVEVMGSTEDGEAANVPFLLRKPTETEYTEVDEDGSEVSGGGLFVVTVTADMLARFGCDRVSLKLTTDGEITSVCALLTQPRYTDNE